jgi:hypothetical protein
MNIVFVFSVDISKLFSSAYLEMLSVTFISLFFASSGVLLLVITTQSSANHRIWVGSFMSFTMSVITRRNRVTLRTAHWTTQFSMVDADLGNAQSRQIEK